MTNEYVANGSDIPSAFRLDKRSDDLAKALLSKLDHDDEVSINPEVYVPEHKKSEEQQLDDDFKLARDNIKELMELNIEKVREYSELVSGTDSPRAFEVFSKMIDSSVELNHKLISLHQEKNKTKESIKVDAPQTTLIQNQQINMLSPLEAIRMIKGDAQEEKEV